MKNKLYAGIFCTLFAAHLYSQTLSEYAAQSLQFAQTQMQNTINEIGGDSTRHPLSTNPSSGEWVTTQRTGWTSGFFSGCAWYLTELADSAKWTKFAVSWTEDLESQKDNTGDHDVGFRIMSSFGNAYRLYDKNRNKYKNIILTAANSLASRYDADIDCIRSWDWGSWNYPVIIDNMMNLELLFWAAENGGGENLRNIAIRHALKTLEHHVREDGGSCHVVDFNDDGSLRGKYTHQGYSAESTWARGQAWGVYGFTVAYRYTQNETFLNAAGKLADYFIQNLPDDKIPFYDFDDPNIPNVAKDASAAAIACAALFELHTYAPANNFQEAALHILESLMVNYTAKGTNLSSILQRGCERKGGEEKGLIYADYYFLEALSRARSVIPLNSAQMADSITQFGITWRFDKKYEIGRFVNGDYWVVGPAVIESVTPNPGKPIVDETERYNYIRDFINQYGDSELENDNTMRNGSMVNPEWGAYQGYDSGSKSYLNSLSVSFPYEIKEGESLISTVSHSTLPNTPLLPFYNEKSRSVLKTAAILTCLEQAPPKDAFRPPYASTWKPIYRAENIDWDILPNLQAVSQMPSIAEMERLVERPWLDHINNWMLGGTAPTENLASYGREFARTVSLVGMRLLVDGTQTEKEKLLYGFIQLGIDLHGLRKAGAKWHMGGGISSGRKWPVVFASVLLGDEEMQQFSGASEFHEDQQTYYGESWTGETALWQMVRHHGIAPMYEHKHPNDWTDMDRRSHSYRVCCNGLAWIGEALGALLIEAKQVWNHDAFFDYNDRFINESKQPYIDAGLSSNINLIGKAFDPFIQNMYEAYRESVPEQPGAAENMKWDPSQGDYVVDENAPTSIEKNNAAVNRSFKLYQNYPNPFNPLTVIQYRIAAKSNVRLTMYNALGQVVRTLVNQTQSAGEYSVRFSAIDCASGVYYLKLTVGSSVQARKMLLIR